MADKAPTNFSLFGWEIARKIGVEDDSRDLASPISADQDLGDTATVQSAGYFGQYYDLTGLGGLLAERDLILKYRQAAEQPEVDAAIDDIVDEAIASPDDGEVIKLVLNNLEYDQSIRDKIIKEFRYILKLLQFSKNAHDIFRRWYIDGRLYFHLVIDRDKPADGIFDMRLIDSACIRRIKEIKEHIDIKSGAKLAETVDEFYVYDESVSIARSAMAMGGGVVAPMRFSKESIIEVNSGIMDATRTQRLSFLHKALKTVNQLRIMEDALVIYRLARAPERRIFYIDTGNLPKGKAEEYFRGIMAKYRNKIVYDIKTGEVNDDRRQMSMLEDFWIPRREGSQGTQIETLPGGENLGQIDDILYFRTQLYKALNVPATRIDSEASFPGGAGRATEITRDEVKFQKFINRLRKRFSYLFIETLKIQLILKGIITKDDWEKIAETISIDYIQDNHFYELKEFETLQDKLTILGELTEHVGKYFSEEWIRRNILHHSDEDIAEMDKQMAAEKKANELTGDDTDDDTADDTGDDTDDDTADDTFEQ